VAERLLMKKHDPASSLFHLSPGRVTDFFRTRRVEQDAHLRAGASPLRQRVRYALTEHALLPEEGFEVHRFSRRSDAREQHVEERAVFEYFDLIAANGCAETQTGEGRKQRIDGRIAFDAQQRIAVTLDRPDDDRQQHDEANE